MESLLFTTFTPMHATFKICGLAIGILVGSCGSSSTNGKPPSALKQLSPQAQAGKKIYTKNCVTCHGAMGNAGINGASNLQETTLSASELTQVIKNGRKNMPAPYATPPALPSPQ